MECHLRQVPRWPSDVNPAIPHSLSVTLMKALAKDPAERFQSATEFLNALTHMPQDDAATLQTMVIAAPDLQEPPSTPAKPGASAPMGKAGPVSGAPVAGKFEPAVLDSVSRDLAAFIGPIAKVVVKRAAERCSSVDELYSAVAAEIDSQKDRSSFLAHRRR